MSFVLLVMKEYCGENRSIKQRVILRQKDAELVWTSKQKHSIVDSQSWLNDQSVDVNPYGSLNFSLMQFMQIVTYIWTYSNVNSNDDDVISSFN